MAKNWIARAIPKSHRGIFSAKAKRAGVRDLQPARDAFAVTKSDTDDLPVYGKLAVFNAHATNAEVIRVVPVGSQDNTVYVDIKVPVGLAVIDWLIVRAVRSTETVADIAALVLT